MKVQCSCGTKYSFDVTPEMAQNPLQLVCQNCGTDLSDYVNDLIRRELQATQALAVPAAAPLPPGMPPPPGSPLETPPGPPRMRISTPAAPAVAAAVAPPAMPVCLKHPPNRTTNNCLVCQKPICPECMKLFGYVCSPLCREKAELKGIKIPKFAGQRDQIEAREWRKTGLIAGAVAAVVVGLLGLYFWYIFAGCLPRQSFALQFPEGGAGQTVMADKGQLIYLHGEQVGRFDLKKNEQVWQHEIPMVARHPHTDKTGSKEDFEEAMDEMDLFEAKLKVAGGNIWVIMPGKMQSFDWDTGSPRQEIPQTGGSEAIIQKDELLIVGNEPGNRTIKHISFADGSTHTEKVNEPADIAKTTKATLAGTKANTVTNAAGLPKSNGSDVGLPLDPNLVANQVSRLSTPQRIALPVLLINAEHQTQVMNAMSDDEDLPSRPPATPAAKPKGPPESLTLLPMEDGCLQFSVRLLEERSVVREAMKERPKTSALSGARAVDTRAVANEILNDMQRDRGMDKVVEDQSRYWVTLRRSDEKAKTEWVGEVVGPTGLIPLKSVNALVSGDMVRVFDKDNRKLWEAKLGSTVALRAFDPSGGYNGLSSGEGPCVERDNTLYVADQVELTAFDLKSGEVRWRLPSVGITGVFFDEAGMIYVNSTTASLDSIKYSRQIDVGGQVDNVILKIDPRSGKTLWKSKPSGDLNYISGKYLYIVSMHGGHVGLFGTGLGTAPYMIIERVNPRNGKIMWNYQEKRQPIHVEFHDNTIQLVFRNEIEGLKFYTF